ncbi:YihY/virulence factor BrkB family protein [Paracoccus sp. p4-l81]|uniref:YihY/virulence factor BrkB family protein n=1 Tax=unclassified Paracoccus (in: a-proteobacteria) TaxID=2688777 RepID=UPI0035BA6841
MTDQPLRDDATDPDDAARGKMILLGLGAAALGVLVARRAPETADKIVRVEERLGGAAATLAAGGGVAAGFAALKDDAPPARRSAILDWITDEAQARMIGAISGQPVDRPPVGTQLAMLARVAGDRLTHPGKDRAKAGLKGKADTDKSDDAPDTAEGARSGPGRGIDADSPTEIPARGWFDVLKRTAREIGKDRVITFAGGITFFALLALFPAITALVSIYGLFADQATIAGHVDALSAFVPEGGLEIITGQIERISSADGTALGIASLVSLAVALWSANGGMKAMIEGLNVAYGEHEQRGFFKLNATAFGFTLGAMALIIGMIGVIAVIPALLAWLPFSPSAEALMTWGRWPLVFVLMMIVLAALYRFGPSRQDARFAWTAPGTIVAAIGLMGFSMLFSWYAANFANYNQTYGSLGAAIGFMTWMWLSATIILAGAELNHETERQTARDTTTGPDKPLGARGAHGADTVA